MPNVAVFASVIVLAGVTAFGQDAPKKAFEVASVRPYVPPEDGRRATAGCEGGPGTSDPERLHCTTASLVLLIVMAYDVQYYQVAGPPWIETDGYEVSAKVPPGTRKAEFREMLQAFLAERFGLVLQRATKDRLSYTLVTAKGGSKVQRSGEGVAPAFAYDFTGGRMHITVRKRPLDVLAGFLSTKLGVEGPVENKTGLAGDYDFALEFTPELAMAGDPDGLSVFTALESQLGLKLEAKKTPTEVLTVERAEKKPTGN